MIVGLGDCNMSGAERFEGKTYMELLSQALGEKTINRGITMTTTREGLIILDEYESPSLLIVAYGLVDSWKTFKYAPYVLYYPDNFFRKVARKMVKKYKKLARKWGLNERLGQKYVVSPEEYRANIVEMIQKSPKTLLIETPPHRRQTFRNPDIRRYNAILQELSRRFDNVELIEIYDDFAKDRELYFDDIHMSQKGYELVAKKILEKL
ncbi:MAG: hypothetical protein C6H99_02470 [Epsilonproteobacteria bacterium]|nr:hypothetical protein [Campylobacterota bacterium]NPA64694.1 SGNH/GDSL hydrolase family protein [Campylobacterota bacterium]